MASVKIIMKRATIYKIGDQLIISSSSQTLEGFWISNGYVAKIPFSDADQIVERLNEAFSYSVQGLNRKISQSDLDELVRPILEESSTPNWRQFCAKAACVHASSKMNVVRFMPTKRKGQEFKHLPGKALLATGDMVESLSKCFDDCE